MASTDLIEVPDSSGWSASQYNKTASFVYSDSYIAPVLDLLDPQPRDHIFDFGCGSGEVTLRIVEMVGEKGLVVGVDYSESMVSPDSYVFYWTIHLCLDRESQGQWSSVCLCL